MFEGSFLLSVNRTLKNKFFATKAMQTTTPTVKGGIRGSAMGEWGKFGLKKARHKGTVLPIATEKLKEEEKEVEKELERDSAREKSEAENPSILMPPPSLRPLRAPSLIPLRDVVPFTDNEATKRTTDSVNGAALNNSVKDSGNVDDGNGKEDKDSSRTIAKEDEEVDPDASDYLRLFAVYSLVDVPVEKGSTNGHKQKPVPDILITPRNSNLRWRETSICMEDRYSVYSDV